MTGWLLAAFVLVAVALAVWFTLATLAGFISGTFQGLRYVFRIARGRDPGLAPWDRPAVLPPNTTPVPFEVRAAVWARDEGQCVYCGATEDLTVDHVIPRAHGGSNHPSNLVTSCRPCNSSKGTGDAPGRGAAHVALLMSRSIGAARKATNGHH